MNKNKTNSRVERHGLSSRNLITYLVLTPIAVIVLSFGVESMANIIDIAPERGSNFEDFKECSIFMLHCCINPSIHWECSNEQIGNAGLRPYNPPNRAPTPSAPVATVTPVDAGGAAECRVVANTIREAISLFNAQCSSATFRDCDPVPGRWECGSQIGNNSSPVTPQPVVTSPVPVVNSSVIRLEAESADRTGTRWELEDPTYLVYRNANSFTSVPDVEFLEYQFTAPATGTYQLRLRARAIQQTPGRNDLHNDAWIKMDGNPVNGVIDVRDFTKVFTSGDGNWHIGGTAQTTVNSPFRQNLNGGQTYTLTVAGRSQGYGIDYFEVLPFALNTTLIQTIYRL